MGGGFCGGHVGNGGDGGGVTGIGGEGRGDIGGDSGGGACSGESREWFAEETGASTSGSRRLRDEPSAFSMVSAVPLGKLTSISKEMFVDEA